MVITLISKSGIQNYFWIEVVSTTYYILRNFLSERLETRLLMNFGKEEC